MYKRSLMILNLLILLSILILPTLIFVSINNVSGVVSSIKFENTTQSMNNGKIIISSQISLHNPGPFEVGAGFTAYLKGSKGAQVDINGPQLSFPSGTRDKVPVVVEIDMSKLSEDDLKNLIFESENLTLTIKALMSMQPIIAIGAEASVKTTWMPPLHNLTVGTPIVRNKNSTHFSLEVPISFENLSSFDINAVEKIRIYDSSNQQVGLALIPIISKPQTMWSNKALVTFEQPKNAKYLILNDTELNFQVKTDFTLTDSNITIRSDEYSFRLDWGALIKDPRITITYTPVNATYTRVTSTLSFTNNNRYISLDATIAPKIIKEGKTTWMGPLQQIQTETMTYGSYITEMVVPNQILLEPNSKLVLIFTTRYGYFNLEVSTLG